MVVAVLLKFWEFSILSEVSEGVWPLVRKESVVKTSHKISESLALCNTSVNSMLMFKYPDDINFSFLNPRKNLIFKKDSADGF